MQSVRGESLERVRVAAAVAGFSVFALAGACAHESAAPPPALSDVTLTLPLFDSISVPLEGEVGQIETDDGMMVVRAGLTDWRVVGDLDGDGATEAVAVVWATGGGSGTFYEFAAFDLVAGAWVWTGSTSLGDRVRIESLTASEGDVTLRLTEHGPEDPMCCPTRRVERRYRLRPEGVVLTDAHDVGPEDPAA